VGSHAGWSRVDRGTPVPTAWRRPPPAQDRDAAKRPSSGERPAEEEEEEEESSNPNAVRGQVGDGRTDALRLVCALRGRVINPSADFRGRFPGACGSTSETSTMEDPGLPRRGLTEVRPAHQRLCSYRACEIEVVAGV
jgi:hypothetical protein